MNIKTLFGALAATTGLATSAGALDLEQEMFEAAKQKNTVQAYSIFLETFPNSAHSEEVQRLAAGGCAPGSALVTTQTGSSSWDSECVPYS